MNEISVTMYQRISQATLDLKRLQHAAPAEKAKRNAENVVKAVTTLGDMLEYVRENLGRTVPDDHYTSIKYDEVSVRRVKQVNRTFKQVLESFPSGERLKETAKYNEDLLVVRQFIKHLEEQITKDGK